MNTTIPLQIRQIAVERTVSLRHEVLWPDMPIDNVKLPEDKHGWHFGAFVDESLANDDPIAVISLFLDHVPIDNGAAGGSGAFPDNDSINVPSEIIAVRFRKFACKTNMQGQGVGTALLKHAMQFARSELKAEVFWCDARVSSAAWYSGRGLSQFGHKFFKGPVEILGNSCPDGWKIKYINGGIRLGDVRKANIIYRSHADDVIEKTFAMQVQ